MKSACLLRAGDEMRKLRLLLFEDCDRNCEGCCNKDWDLKSLPYCDDFSTYDLIMLTGGEPLLYPQIVLGTIFTIRMQSDAKIIVYTAKTDDIKSLETILFCVDGLTVTLHEQFDVINFIRFNNNIIDSIKMNKSLRLNVFDGVNIEDKSFWNIKRGIKWIKNCPLPENEVLMRFKTFV